MSAKTSTSLARFQRRVPRVRFLALVLGLAFVTAVAAAVLLTKAYAAPVPASAAAAAAQSGNTDPTYVEKVLREWETLKQHLALFLGTLGFLLVALLGMFVYFGRASGRVGLLWGFAEFELPDALRNARVQLAKVRASESRLVRAMSDFYGLAASLSDIAATARREEIREFAGLCTEATQQILSAYKSSAWLFDPKAQVLRIFAGQRVSSRTIHNFTLAPGKGFAGHVYEEKRPRRLDDVAQEKDLFERDPYAPQDIGAIVGVPIWGQNGQAVGVLCASHSVGGEKFSAEDTTLISLYADLISVAVHLARLSHVELW